MGHITLKAPPPFSGTEVHTLPNGLSLVLKEDHTVPVVSLQAWARCGAVDESPAIYGISHGLEHMVFKGTPSRDAGEITRAIEWEGGYVNAATQLETTHYYIDVPSDGLNPALDVLADAVLNPTFPPDELDRERLVILEEIAMRDDSPDATLWDEFASTVFEGTPYGIKVIGSRETVTALSQKDLLTYYRKHYVPSNKCIVLVGDFNRKTVLEKLTGLFGSEAPGSKPDRLPIKGRAKPFHRILKRPVQLSYLAVGTQVPGLGSEDMIALDVLSDVLGGGISSRFYQHLRERERVVLNISCDYIPFEPVGLFAVFAETRPNDAQRALAAINNELAQIETVPIHPDELQRAKARLKSEWLHSSETPRGRASTLGSLAVQGRLHLIEHYLERMDNMTVDDLMGVYNRNLKGVELSSTLLVPQA